jgi:endonuclease G, mitochondrial
LPGAFLALAVTAAAGPAPAAPSFCPEHYPGGAAPDLIRPALRSQERELCFGEYAVLYSGVSRTPLAAAEHLTRERVQAARRLGRENRFHEEESLPPEQRAHLADYVRSGFDRGHMAPSGDMSTPETQAESFSLANMVPQNPGLNRCLWEGIESAVRDLAVREGEVWVMTGPLFEGESLERLNGRVLVPTSLYKAVYVPAQRAAAAYVAPNAPGGAWREVPLAELRDRAGIAVFPALPAAVLGRTMPLPEPRPRNLGGSCGEAPVVAANEAPRAPGGAKPPPAGPAPGSTLGQAGGITGSPAFLVLAGLVALVLCWLLYRLLGRR